MSVKVMAWVWEHGPANSAERLVLLALADFSDDTGLCWPSMGTIAAKACCTERGAQKIVRRLEAGGWVRTIQGGGRGGCNRYRITMENPAQETPNRVHPPNTEHRMPEQKPRTRVQKTPNGGSPEPSRTIKIHAAAAARARVEDGFDTHCEVLTAARIDLANDISGKWLSSSQRFFTDRWLKSGLTHDQIVSVVAERAAHMPRPPNSLKFFDDLMGEALARAQAPPLEPATRVNGTRSPTDAERLDAYLDELKARVAVQRLE